MTAEDLKKHRARRDFVPALIGLVLTIILTSLAARPEDTGWFLWAMLTLTLVFVYLVGIGFLFGAMLAYGSAWRNYYRRNVIGYDLVSWQGEDGASNERIELRNRREPLPANTFGVYQKLGGWGWSDGWVGKNARIGYFSTNQQFWPEWQDDLCVEYQQLGREILYVRARHTYLRMRIGVRGLLCMLKRYGTGGVFGLTSSVLHDISVITELQERVAGLNSLENRVAKARAFIVGSSRLKSQKEAQELLQILGELPSA